MFIKLKSRFGLCLLLVLFMVALGAEACLEFKLCCIELEPGKPECVQKCVDEYCEVGYYEIKL